MYAVVRTGGKQYRAEPGKRLRVDRLAGEPGDTVELTDVLLLARDGDVTVGSPTITSTKVVAEIMEQSRGGKISVFKYKSKVRYRRLRGHRQLHTILSVREIVEPGRRHAAAEKAPAEPGPDAEKPAAKKRAAATKTTAEKPATKKPATKKPATKKPAAKRPAAKKRATATKTAAKKRATKKPATKKTTAKKSAAKKPATKKRATKTTTARKRTPRKET